MHFHAKALRERQFAAWLRSRNDTADGWQCIGSMKPGALLIAIAEMIQPAPTSGQSLTPDRPQRK